MIELPEATVLASQVTKTLSGKRIKKVVANQNPYKFAWFYGDPKNYEPLLQEKIIDNAASIGGLVEIKVSGAILLFGDGASIRYYDKGSKLPPKHL